MKGPGKQTRWLLILKRDKREAARFLAVGLSNTIVGLSGVALGEYVVRVNYVWANVIGYSLGVTNSFVWNKLWTFKSLSWNGAEAIRFVAAFGASYALQFLVVTAMIRSGRLSEMVCQAIGMCSYTAANYLLNKRWTFRKKGRCP